MQARYSRHYYDLARLYRHEYGRLAITDFGLLASVVEHKKVFFREAAARYDLAKPGSLRICPPDDKIARIRSDYRDMREMFFTEPPPFDSLMADLRELEDRVNTEPETLKGSPLPAPWQNRDKTPRVEPTWFAFERKPDSPSC